MPSRCVFGSAKRYRVSSTDPFCSPTPCLPCQKSLFSPSTIRANWISDGTLIDPRVTLGLLGHLSNLIKPGRAYNCIVSNEWKTADIFLPSMEIKEDYTYSVSAHLINLHVYFEKLKNCDYDVHTSR